MNLTNVVKAIKTLSKEIFSTKTVGLGSQAEQNLVLRLRLSKLALNCKIVLSLLENCELENDVRVALSRNYRKIFDNSLDLPFNLTVLDILKVQYTRELANEVAKAMREQHPADLAATVHTGACKDLVQAFHADFTCRIAR